MVICDLVVWCSEFCGVVKWYDSLVWWCGVMCCVVLWCGCVVRCVV